jgi:hypothetical protein
LFTLTACGGGGSSGWSKTDERRFVNDGTVEQGFDEETVDCFLQFARDDFDTYDEYVKATGGGLDSDDATEAGKRYINEAIDACPVAAEGHPT